MMLIEALVFYAVGLIPAYASSMFITVLNCGRDQLPPFNPRKHFVRMWLSWFIPITLFVLSIAIAGEKITVAVGNWIDRGEQG